MTSNTVTKFKLSNEALAAFIQSVQAAILTGTDISDLLRMITLECEPVPDGSVGYLKLAPEYINAFNDSMSQMLERALSLEEEANQVVE